MTVHLVTEFTLSHPVSNIEAANRYLASEDMTRYLGPTFPSVLNISWRLKTAEAGTVSVIATEDITHDELEGLREWISDQNSDGLGESFAEQAFAVHGHTCSEFNWESDDYVLRPSQLVDAGRTQLEVAASALEDAAAQMERTAQRTDNRLTEHAVVDAGGAMLLREYARVMRDGLHGE